jgi:tripartite-type tricarboxylate transporter receptor subunit TctC
MKLKNPSRRDMLITSAGTLLAAVDSPVHSQIIDNSKLVKVLVGFPAGQATDMVTRVLVEKLRSVTGDNYLVDNRPGQGGSLALGQLAKSPANGSVMMIAHMSAVATNPHIYKSVPYDSNKDFEAVGLIGDLPFVLVCNPNLPIRSIKDLIAYAKANPDKLNNASSGNGTVSHLTMEEFKRKAGISMTHIPYKGSVSGLTDVMSGNVSLALETASTVQAHVEAGRLRAIAVGSSKRLGGVLANVPTMIEQGFSDFNAVTWLMLLYPSGTPKELIKNTHKALNSVLGQSSTEQKLLSLGLLPRTSASPEDAATYLHSELKSWGEIVSRSGLEKE